MSSPLAPHHGSRMSAGSMRKTRARSAKHSPTYDVASLAPQSLRRLGRKNVSKGSWPLVPSSWPLSGVKR